MSRDMVFEMVDMTCLLPQDAWTDADATLFSTLTPPTDCRWRIVEYSCETHAGRLLWGVGDDAPVLTLPLDLDGWHAVELLIGYADIEVRLSGDEHWQRIVAHAPRETNSSWRDSGMWGRPLLWEPLRFADLTGKSLEIRVPPLTNEMKRHGVFPAGALWGVRATPLPPEHVEKIRTAEERRLVYVNDGFSIFFYAEETSLDIVKNAINPFLKTPTATCCFGTAQRGFPNYPSKLVDHQKAQGWAFVREGEARYKQHILTLIGRGEDPLQYAIDSAHGAGQRFWMYLRPQMWSMPVPFDHAFHSDFYAKHPHCRCLEADGTPISKLSIAYPEVRENHAAYMREGLERGADGICLALTRGYPLVRYEQPVLDRFQELYGLDARTLPETDERLQAVWSEFVTAWMAEIRSLLDETGGTPLAPRRELAAFLHTPERCKLFGLDVETWARDGLIDVVMPSGGTAEEKEFWSKICAYTTAQYIPDLLGDNNFGGGNDKTLRSFRAIAHACYEAGADGLTCWDTPHFLADLQLQCPAVQKLWVETYMHDECVVLKTLSGESLRPYNPALGG